MKRRAVIMLVLGLGFCGGYLTRHWDAVLADGEGSLVWTPDLRGDVNDDADLDICDAIYILNYLFIGGPEPAEVECESSGKSGVLQTQQLLCYSGDRGELQDPCPVFGEQDHGQDPQFKAFGIERDFELVQPDPEDRSTWYTLDHTTGLMWQHQSELELRDWTDALAHISTLELGGFDDWRMPNINELFSIVDISRRNPAGFVDGDFFFMFPVKYWSSSTCVIDLSRAWTVDFAFGAVGCLDKGGQGQNTFKLRTLAVRNFR